MSDLPLRANMAAELRAAFDRTFALPSGSQDAIESESLLAIRLAGVPYAIRLREISGLANDRKTIAVPSAIGELAGIASLRGELVPVYSLAALLNLRPGPEEARWLALCGGEEPIGLAFTDFEGYLKVPLADIYAARVKNAMPGYVTEVARAAGLARSVINIPAIVAMVKKRCAEDRTSSKKS